MERSKRDYLVIVLKGMAMGAADIVPGVSGGTIALIAGIYEEFINSLKSFSNVLMVWQKEGWTAAWKHINGKFLIALVSGIVISLLSLVGVITYGLEYYPVIMWAFFFGLILASTYFVGKRVEKWNVIPIIGFLIGAALIFLITSVSRAETPTDLWFVFISGMLAICAMLLPGISGAYILVLLGKYAYVLQALSDLNFKVISVFVLGCISGILSFSHLLSWMLRKHHNFTLALLTGFMLGSLNVIWPWKKTLEWEIDRHGEKIPLEQINVSPMNFEGDNHLVFALIIALVGFVSIFVMEKLASSKVKDEIPDT